MKKIFSFVLIILAVSFSACELDSNLFNAEKIDTYKLPGNNIPDSLITEVSFLSGNNTLYGFWIKSGGERPGITILYCHGNKHNIDEYWDRVMLFHETGVNVFIFDYRGFGKSGGESSESGLYADGLAALNYVKSRPEYYPDSLVLYGYSLGNVVSIYLSAETINPLCLFAECPFASANSLTQGSLGLDIPPLWLTQGDFNNAGRIKNIHTPFLLFHGEDDDFVRYRDNGLIVYNAAPQPKELILVPGASHTDIPSVYGTEKYKAKLLEFIDRPGN